MEGLQFHDSLATAMDECAGRIAKGRTRALADASPPCVSPASFLTFRSVKKPRRHFLLLALVLTAEIGSAASPTPTSAGATTPTPAATASPEEKLEDLPAPKQAAMEPQLEITPTDRPSTGPASKTTTPDISPLKVTLTPGQTGPRDVYDELTIFVELANTGKETIILNYVYLQIGDDVKRTRDWIEKPPAAAAPASALSGGRPRGALNHPDDGIWEGREESGSIVLNPNGSRTERLVIPRAYRGFYLLGLALNPSLLTFSPGEQDVHVMVEYAVGSQSDGSLRSTLKVPFTSTWGAIMLGGCLGVVMLCVLRVIVASEKEFGAAYLEPGAGMIPINWGPVFRRARHSAARELIAASVWFPSVMIISFLLWRMGPSSFPITFQVNDFAGGVLLGLFTRALVEPLIRKLFPDPATSSGK